MEVLNHAHVWGQTLTLNRTFPHCAQEPPLRAPAGGIIMGGGIIMIGAAEIWQEVVRGEGMPAPW